MLVSVPVQCQVNFHQQSKHKKSSISIKRKSLSNGWLLTIKQKEINHHDKVKGHVKIINHVKMVGDHILEKSKDLSDS